MYNKDNEPHEFESEWSKLLFDYKDHKLDENVWLSTMYNIRAMWVILLILDLFIWVVYLGLHQGQKVRINFFTFL